MKGVSTTPFLGVIGGMGPAATADFLAKLVHLRGAERDQDNVPVLVWGDCRVPDRTDALHLPRNNIGDRLAAAAKVLSDNGAAAIVMPCNTAHAWSACIEAASPARFLHIADAVMARLEQCRAKRVALMATRGALSAGIYQARFAEVSIDLLLPDESEQDDIGVGISLVKSGRIDAARDRLSGVVNALRDRGAELIVLACTELPLALSDEALFLDSTQCLAEYACQWWSCHCAFATAAGQ